MPRVFISNAKKDEVLALAFSNLLIEGLGLSPSEVFCSSLIPPPAGVPFKDYIRSQLEETKWSSSLNTTDRVSFVSANSERPGDWTRASFP